jgi:hypothetical protein
LIVCVLTGACSELPWEIILPREQPLPPRDGSRRDPSEPGAVRLERRGTIHRPRPGDHNRTVDIQVGAGKYRLIELELDIAHGGWFAAEPERNHSLFWLHRGHGQFAGNAVAYVNAFGPRRNEVRLATNLTLARGARMEASKATVRLEPGQTYHLRYLYDGPRRRTELVVTRGGRVVSRITGRAPQSALEAPASGVFFVSFGHRNNGARGPERPTYGWRYSNLEVVFRR